MFSSCHQRFATLSCQNENCRTNTYVAAQNGHLECLQYAHLHGCHWHPETTRVAARNGHLECLKYIFDNCNIQWQDTKLEENFEDFSKETQDFIEHVKEYWKAGLNKPGRNVKSAQNKINKKG